MQDDKSLNENYHNQLKRSDAYLSRTQAAEAYDLSKEEGEAVTDPFIRSLVENKHLLLQRVIKLEWNQLSNLKSPGVHALMNSGHLTKSKEDLEKIIGLSTQGKHNLNSYAVRAQITSGKITLDGAIAYTAKQTLKLESQAAQIDTLTMARDLNTRTSMTTSSSQANNSAQFWTPPAAQQPVPASLTTVQTLSLPDKGFSN